MNPTPVNGVAASNGPETAKGNTNGPTVKRIVKKSAANPFASARQPGKLVLPNGQRAKLPPSHVTATKPPTATVVTKVDPNSTKYSGFSDPVVASKGKTYTDYKLIATKKDILDGLRYHILHLANEKSIDIRDPKQFPPPAHLHRRDPRFSGPISKDDDEQIEIKDGMNEAERQAIKDRNEQRKLERAANLAQIAPAQSSRKGPSGKTKTKAVNKREYTEEEKRRIQTNYEEKMPWHLEDFDNKNCFIGQNIGPAARRYVALAHEPAVDAKTGRFRLIPVERMYEFQPKRAERNEVTIEEAEARMKKRAVMPEWLERLEHKAMERKKNEFMAQGPRLFTGENKDSKGAGRTGEDVDLDLDDDDLFADDEEGDTYRVKDEDEALAEKRIREDQLKANFFDWKEEADYDVEEEKEKKEEEERKQNTKRIRKALEKHEGNYNHGSDSEYSSSSEDDEETAERERQEAERQKNLTGQSLQPDGSKPTAPASGATTPLGRKDRGALSDREGGKNSRKRPGSPMLSDAGSATDTSTRKKPKIKHGLNISRPDTPSGQKLKVRGPGAGSDTDAATMSDSTRRRKHKHKTSGVTSRAGSPPPLNAGVPIRSGAASPPVVTMPTVDDIVNTLRTHPDGISMAEFIKKVPYPKNEQSKYMALLRQTARIVTRENMKYLVEADKGARS